MTPLPGALGGGQIVAWRLDQAIYAASWDSGEGAFRQGGRWSGKNVRAVYCAIDPATTILELAVHKGFNALDVVPHILTSVEILDPAAIHVVTPAQVPNPRWLESGIVSAGQQAYGNALLSKHAFVLLPSVASANSWNLIFEVTAAKGKYRMLAQERLRIDTRLNPIP